jgi:hypothetical protein
VEFNGHIYAVDDRKKTVDALSSIEEEGVDAFPKIIGLLLGEKAAKDINLDELPFPAVIDFITVITSAATGEDPKTVGARFQESRPSAV